MRLAFIAPVLLLPSLAHAQLNGGTMADQFGYVSSNLKDVSEVAIGADDFLVPADVIWNIDRVVVLGDYSRPGNDPTPPGRASTVNVYLFADNNGEPAAANLAQGLLVAENLDFTDLGNGDFDILLGEQSIALSSGRYWLAVSANMSLSNDGQWNWLGSTGDGAVAVWQQSDDLIGNGGQCVNSWGARTADCGLNGGTAGFEHFAFSLFGRAEVDLIFGDSFE